jgi:hypothetical protein
MVLARTKDASNKHFQMMVGVFPGRVCQGQPGSVILSVNDQCDRIILLLVNKQHNHLTIAALCSVMWARTIGMRPAGNVQIECLHGTKVSLGQLLIGPNLNLFTGLIENQKGE